MEKCWICGKPGEINRNLGSLNEIFHNFDYFEDNVQRCYCNSCYQIVSNQLKEDQKEYIRLKKKLMFERAVRTLERQRLHIYDYEEAIKAVQEYSSEHPEKFDSSHEMIAAIILIDNEIPCKIHYPIGKYHCDFCLPSLKVILEIDGERHKNKRLFDSLRDNDIRNALGPGWEIIRIGTEHLETKADMLVEAINTILSKRRSSR